MSKKYGSIQQLARELKGMRYDVKEMTSTKIAVLTNSNRVNLLKEIASKIGAYYDNKPITESSIGRLEIDDLFIYAKPASKQGTSSAGVDNEVFIVNQINNCVKSSDGFIPKLIFDSGKNKLTIKDVIGAKRVGADTSGRKKADFLIETKTSPVPISLKKDGAEMWESADKYYGAKAKKKVDTLAKQGKIALKKISKNGPLSIEPNVAIKADTKEMLNVIFGSDLIQGNGAVVTKTFKNSDIALNGDTLTIYVSSIITNMGEVPDEYEPYFLIRNDKTRNSPGLYPGLRVLAVYKSRINKNVLVVK